MMYDKEFEEECRKKLNEDRDGNRYLCGQDLKDMTGKECVDLIKKVISREWGNVPNYVDRVTISKESLDDYASLYLFFKILNRYAPKFVELCVETKCVHIDLRSIRASVGLTGPVIDPRPLWEACDISDYYEIDPYHKQFWQESKMRNGDTLSKEGRWEILTRCINERGNGKREDVTNKD